MAQHDVDRRHPDGTPRIPLSEIRRIRSLVGLDRATVATRCPRCGDELECDTDDDGTGIRTYLDCHNPDCDYPGECA